METYLIKGYFLDKKINGAREVAEKKRAVFETS